MMIGGFIYWVFSGFQGNYNEQLNQKKSNRSFWIGYLSIIIIITLILISLFK
jgi:hypothetical protein